MKLRRCSVGGIIYGNTNDRGDFRSSKMSSILSKVGNGPSSRRSEELSDFWQCLSVCHTVVVEEEDVIFEKEDNDNERKQGETVTRPTRSTSARRLSQPSGLKKRVYRAESPDEGALVDGAATMGYCLMDRTNVLTKVKRIADNKMFQYSVLAINAFNSTRKRMSVLVKTDDDQYILWIKGADNVMIERASSSTQSDTITKHLSTFASDGLRTLVLGKKVIKKEDAEEWLNEYQFASESVDNRKEKLAQAAEKIEQNVSVIFFIIVM
jgi:magnesium-transporting ATPase (P-type)